MITGVVGSIKWGTPPGWYTAAGIHGYTVTCTKAGQWSLSAQLVLANAFNLSQRPLVFVAKLKDGEWRWPIASMTLDKDTQHISAQLGAPET